MNYYRLFVKPGCPFCESAIRHLANEDKTFVAIQTKDENLNKIKKYYDWSTVPLIVKIQDSEEAFVGGCSDLTGE